MADNILLQNGDTVAADDISGIKFCRHKFALGNNNTNDGDVSSTNPMPTSGTTESATGAAVPVKATQVAGSDGTNLLALRVKTSDGTASEVGLLTRPIQPEKSAYGASVLGLVPVATPTDVFTLTGSASKVIKVRRISVSGTQTVTGIINMLLIKRSAANTGGTSAPATAVPYDSTNAAATGTVLTYTANPTLGAAVGTLQTHKVLVSAPASTSRVDLFVDFDRPGVQPLILRGVTEVLALNLNSATLTGGSLNISIEWSEE